MNSPITLQINPAKLLLSKWTAVQPANKEKHFLVTRVIKDEENLVVACVVEAALTHNSYRIDWRTLKNKAHWLAGWL